MLQTHYTYVRGVCEKKNRHKSRGNSILMVCLLCVSCYVAWDQGALVLTGWSENGVVQSAKRISLVCYRDGFVHRFHKSVLTKLSATKKSDGTRNPLFT